MKSTICLFKAVPIDKNKKAKATKKILNLTMSRGFIFSPEVVGNYSEDELVRLTEQISKEYGITAEKLNASFHKSWKKVRDAKIEDLVFEQILHYFTTYGFEAFGIYDESTVYLPTAKLKIPKLDVESFRFTVIKGYTKEEFKDRLIMFLSSGVALKDDTKNDVVDIATWVDLTQAEVYNIRNKEVRVCMYEYLNLIPSDPIEFLRFVIYRATGKTLVIKNGFTIHTIKAMDSAKTLNVLGAFKTYEKKYGLEKLSSIFFRFKPIFLAFRTTEQFKVIINKIRRLADENHKPMPEDFLNNVTSHISNGKKISEKKMADELKKVNTFRKIRLAYALKYRTDGAESIMYRIRNGKSYATDFSFKKPKEAERVLGLVVDSIAGDVSANVKGRKIYIPKSVNYALPATEKMFTGDFPSGTSVVVPNDMIFGVHWENTGGRVDLDLSLQNVTVGKIGWDGNYRSSSGNILFSGDITDAPKPKGATELFYVANKAKGAYLLMVNFFNFGYSECANEVPFKIIVASEKPKNFGRGYMVDPNNVVTVCKSVITEKQKVLGLLVVDDNACKFYFAESAIGNSITSYGAEYVEHSRRYMVSSFENAVSLEDVLKKAGAKIVNTKPEKCDIDLSPEGIQRDSILNLLVKK